MAMTQYTSSSGTRIWEHLNRIVDEVEALFAVRPKIATGSETIPLLGAGGSKSRAVTFPPGRFTTPPQVVVSLSGTTGIEHKWAVKSGSVTETGCVLWIVQLQTEMATGTVTLHWVAAQD